MGFYKGPLRFCCVLKSPKRFRKSSEMMQKSSKSCTMLRDVLNSSIRFNKVLSGFCRIAKDRHGSSRFLKVRMASLCLKVRSGYVCVSWSFSESLRVSVCLSFSLVCTVPHPGLRFADVRHSSLLFSKVLQEDSLRF